MHEGKTHVALEGVPAGTSMDSSDMWKLVEEEELYSDDFSLDEFKNPTEGSEETHDHQHGNVDGDKVLYNTTTHSMVTPAEIAAGGTNWMLLDEQRFPEYQHPAYYNLGSHFVVDSGGGASNGWMLTSYSAGGHDHSGSSDSHYGSADDGYSGEPHDDHASADAGHGDHHDHADHDDTSVGEPHDDHGFGGRRS